MEKFSRFRTTLYVNPGWIPLTLEYIITQSGPYMSSFILLANNIMADVTGCIL